MTRAGSVTRAGAGLAGRQAPQRPQAVHVASSLALLLALARRWPGLLLRLEREQGLLGLVLDGCLGLGSGSGSGAGSGAEEEADAEAEAEAEAEAPTPLCQDTPSRAAAYALALALCSADASPALALAAHARLRRLHASIPPPPQLGFRPETERRSATGFVGLRNMGCTCYMNALLQVLFMLPPLRQGLLALDLGAERMGPGEAADNSLVQLQRVRAPAAAAALSLLLLLLTAAVTAVTAVTAAAAAAVAASRPLTS